MELKVRTALTGEPKDGDMVDVVMTDGTKLTLVYDPHSAHDQYVWRVQSDVPLAEIKSLYAKLEPRYTEHRWMTCYLSCVREVVVGEPLSFVLVPRVFMYKWPQTLTETVVADIKIR